MRCEHSYIKLNSMKRCENSARHLFEIMAVYNPQRVEYRTFLCDKHSYRLLEKSKKKTRARKIVAKCPFQYIAKLSGKRFRKGKFI